MSTRQRKQKTITEEQLQNEEDRLDTYDEEDIDEEEEENGLVDELEAEGLLGDDDDDDDDESLDDGAIEAEDAYDEFDHAEDAADEEDEKEFGKKNSTSTDSIASGKLKLKFSKDLVKNARKQKKNTNHVSIKKGRKGENSLSITLSFTNTKKLSKVLKPQAKSNNKKALKVKNNKGVSRTRNVKVSYTEPTEDDFGSDFEENGSISKNFKDESNRKDVGLPEEEEEEDVENEDDDDELDDDLDSDEENEQSDVDLSKLSERQRSKMFGGSEDPEDLTPDYYNGKKLPKSVLALIEGGKQKKALTEEEIQLRKAEAARKRKTFNARKLEAEKKETLKKLLHRKIEKVDVKKQAEEEERRKQNLLKRRELITHKALFSWVSKTEVVDGQKTNASYYSMQ